MPKNKLDFFSFSLIFILIAALFSTWGRAVSVPSARPFPNIMSETRPQFTVVIDAGHGGEDGGACTYGGYPEKDLNLLIAKTLRDMLILSGINVIMTREDDRLLYDPSSNYSGHKKSMDLAARLKIANETENAIFISIHMNAFPENQYKGLQVYYSGGSDDSKILAQMIQERSQSQLDPQNRRSIKSAGSNIYLLHRLNGIGVLIECGFLSNELEREKLNTVQYRKELAACFFASIVDFIILKDY